MSITAMCARNRRPTACDDIVAVCYPDVVSGPFAVRKPTERFLDAQVEA